MKVIVIVDVPENSINLERAYANVEIIDKSDGVEFIVRQPNVPLKFLPERKIEYYYDGEYVKHEIQSNIDYNKCIDDLLGETE